MRLFVVLALLCVIFESGAQTPYLERKITVSLKDESVESSLRKIAAAGGFVFSYNPDIFVQNTLTHEFVDRPVREILDELFQGTIQYKARGKYIILTAAQKTSARSEPAVVSGYVVDESTGERLRNVSIYDPVTLTSSITDSYGYFEIKIDRPPSDIILSVNLEHYVDTLVAVPSDNRLLNIPIRVNKDKIIVLADSVNQKLKRFWERQEAWFANVNVRNINHSLYRTFQASFVPYVGTNHKMSAHVVNHYSLNILGGYSLGVRKMEVGGLFNLVRGDVAGFQAAGLFNGVGGSTTGFQVAGLANANQGMVRGAQFAGVLNLGAGDGDGLSTAGVGNIALGEGAPAQIGGVFNIASRGSSQMQLAGVLNFARENVRGMQVGGVFNIAGKELRGTQIAGVFNVAGKEVRGVQIAGVFNAARNVRGMQIGLLNFADSLKGIPIGLMSIVGKGYHKIEISADEIFYNNIAFRTGVRGFYNIFTAGAKPSTYHEERTIWSFGYGLGTSAKIVKWLYLDFDVTSNQIVEGNSITALNLINKAYLGLDVQVFKKVSLSIGATLNGQITEAGFDDYPELFTGYRPHILHTRELGRDHDLRMWLGGKAGIRFL